MRTYLYVLAPKNESYGATLDRTHPVEHSAFQGTPCSMITMGCLTSKGFCFCVSLYACLSMNRWYAAVVNLGRASTIVCCCPDIGRLVAADRWLLSKCGLAACMSCRCNCALSCHDSQKSKTSVLCSSFAWRLWAALPSFASLTCS